MLRGLISRNIRLCIHAGLGFRGLGFALRLLRASWVSALAARARDLTARVREQGLACRSLLNPDSAGKQQLNLQPKGPSKHPKPLEPQNLNKV